MLDILVSHYDEPVATVAAFLSMLDAQDADPSSFRVYVGNDGHDVPVPQEALSGHAYDVRYVETHHGGVSHVRNALIDASDGEYLMLCDVDDRLMDGSCLSRYVTMCDGSDVVMSAFAKGDEPMPPNTLLVHGKAFRRRYLEDNGIRFDDDLTRCSDGYFLVQTTLLTRSVNRTDDVLYVWVQRDGSVCHSEPDFVTVNFWHRVEANGRLAERYAGMGMGHLSRMFSSRLVHQSYLTMHTDAWERHADDFRCRFAVRCLSWWLGRLYDGYASLPEGARRYRFEVATRAFPDPPDAPFDGIGPWVRSLSGIGLSEALSLPAAPPRESVV